jgi:CHAT domain-containing protein
LYDGNQAKLRAVAQNAMALLPEDLQALIADPGIETIFVSPCSRTMSDPWELLPIPDEHGKLTYAGLKKVLVRVHGLEELRQVLGRQVGGSERVVIGDPATQSLQRLEHARAAAVEIGKMVRVQPILDGAANRNTVLAAIRNPNLGLLHFNGHGTFGAVALAGTEHLSFQDLHSIAWAQGPFLHWDCCMAGASWGTGGGRFAGLPPAAIRSGASAVLASFHPLFDKPAKEFSLALYRAMLDSEEPLPLGKALLQARNHIHDNYGIPLYWATSILWGNPEVRLRLM